MMLTMRQSFAVAFLLLAMLAPPACANAQNIALTGPDGATASLTPAALAKLPSISLTESYATEKATEKHGFSGPLLWTVLQAIKFKPAPTSQFITVSGSDGYKAVIAMAEIAPKFETKQVILAETMDGKPLAPGAFRIVVPGDAMGGRYVRDVAAITITTMPHGH